MSKEENESPVTEILNLEQAAKHLSLNKSTLYKNQLDPFPTTSMAEAIL